MKRILTVAAFVAALTYCTSVNAHSVQCNSRARVVAVLGLKYGEVIHGEGVGKTSTVIYELWLSDKGTWSFTGTSTNGVTCLLHAGEGWGLVDAVTPVPKGDGT